MLGGMVMFGWHLAASGGSWRVLAASGSPWRPLADSGSSSRRVGLLKQLLIGFVIFNLFVLLLAPSFCTTWRVPQECPTYPYISSYNLIVGSACSLNVTINSATYAYAWW